MCFRHFHYEKKLVSNEKRLEVAKKNGKKVKELKESVSTLKSMETFFAKAVIKVKIPKELMIIHAVNF